MSMGVAAECVKLLRRCLYVAAGLALMTSTGSARPVAIGPNISTLGVGAEVPVRLSPRFVMRFGGNRFSSTFDREFRGIAYNTELSLASVGVSLDYHPVQDGLLLSVGYFWHRNRLNLRAAPNGDLKVGNRTFTSEEVGSLHGEFAFDRFAPYFGIGYDSTFYNKGPWSFVFRTGLLFLGEADVRLTTDGTLADDDGFRAELRREEQGLEDILEGIGFYPVVTLGFRYRF